jgi:hypothetical protein
VLGAVGSALAGVVAVVPVVGPSAGAFVELAVLVAALRVVAGGFDEDVILPAARTDAGADPRPTDPDSVP